jgi:hypothetical protein
VAFENEFVETRVYDFLLLAVAMTEFLGLTVLWCMAWVGVIQLEKKDELQYWW